MGCFMVYVTVPSQEEAEKIANSLIEDRFAACVNVLGPITSIFSWQGEVRSEKEVAVLIKTSEVLVAALTERITALHSYECPSVVAWPIPLGNRDFLEWIKTETTC